MAALVDDLVLSWVDPDAEPHIIEGIGGYIQGVEGAGSQVMVVTGESGYGTVPEE